VRVIREEREKGIKHEGEKSTEDRGDGNILIY
jgi:hypothetical protein